MSWLEEHLETFVRPRAPEVPETPLGYFEQNELTVLKNAWRSIKRQADGRPVLLPGRDVFLFEVLARRENYPTVFVPECSRMTVRKLSETKPELKDLFLFDTGFAGSIPRNLGTPSNGFKLFSATILNNKAQVFPRLTLSRYFALRIEDSPKYWQSGQIVDGEVKQEFAADHEFVRAARLTIEVYTNSSPKFINQHKPIERRETWMS
jgi:hypothetical protein